MLTAESLPNIHYRLGFRCVRQRPCTLEIKSIISHPSEDHMGRSSGSSSIKLELVGGNIRPVHHNVSSKVMSYFGLSD